jgi:NitT/TauT family transport system substrate-binding protein
MATLLPYFSRGKNMRRLACSLVLAIAALLPDLTTGHAAAAKKIIFITDAGPLGRHSLFYVALDKGYYKQEGLDVEIVGGRGSASTAREIAASAAQFGFADSGTVILSRANEKLPVKLIGIVYAKAPHGLMALSSSGIKRPEDLRGKRLADSSASSNYILFKAYARRIGLDPESVQWVFTDFNSLAGLLTTGQIDAIGQFEMGRAILEKRSNQAVTFLSYAEAGMQFYSNAIIASDKTVAEDPELAKAFLRATRRGMMDAFANPKEAAAITRKYLPLLDGEVIEYETNSVAALARPPERASVPLLTLEKEGVAKTIQLISENFDLKNPVKVDDAASFFDF